MFIQIAFSQGRGPLSSKHRVSSRILYESKLRKDFAGKSKEQTMFPDVKKPEVHVQKNTAWWTSLLVSLWKDIDESFKIECFLHTWVAQGTESVPVPLHLVLQKYTTM